jgi:magnesium transporter
MVSARPPVPSIGLLRFLRSQSENLSFFSPNHASTHRNLGQASRKIFCPSRRQPSISANEGLGPDQETILQAGLLDLQQLFPRRALAPARLFRSKRLAALLSPLAVRYNSSSNSCSPTWRERLWGPRTRKLPSQLKPDDLPERDEDGDTNSMFNTRRQRAQQAALEPRLRCTEVDENGNAILVDGEFKKTELIARVRNMIQHGLRPKSDLVANPGVVWTPTS